jgi:uncharacterized OsmC-like protein
MEEISEKSVTLVREAEGVYVATNAQGDSLRFGYNVDGALSSIELLLTAIAGCSSTDVDMMTSRRSEPTTFEVTSQAQKVTEDGASILRNIQVTFDLEFPEGEDGDKARARVSSALKSAHEKTCTVSRTVDAGVPVELRQRTQP